MQDPLLYRPIGNIPVVIIKEKVSKATGIPLSLMLLGNKIGTARRREYVTARQISMTLSMKYSNRSLAYVGREHGERDHATVLHAVKTINNLLDTKEETVLDWFRKSKQELKEWDLKNNSPFNRISPKKKVILVKYWIKHKVPLFVREFKLLNYNNYCRECGQLIKKL
jgi:hypothetical protein